MTEKIAMFGEWNQWQAFQNLVVHRLPMMIGEGQETNGRGLLAPAEWTKFLFIHDFLGYGYTQAICGLY